MSKLECPGCKEASKLIVKLIIMYTGMMFLAVGFMCFLILRCPF